MSINFRTPTRIKQNPTIPLSISPVDRLWVYTASRMAIKDQQPLAGEMLQGRMSLGLP
jgi:hypothetical protein